MIRLFPPCLFLGLAVLVGPASADPRHEGSRCTSAAISAGANWKGTYSGTAPSGFFPRAWSGERCFASRGACRAWLNRMAGRYSYTTRISRCERL